MPKKLSPNATRIKENFHRRTEDPRKYHQHFIDPIWQGNKAEIKDCLSERFFIAKQVLLGSVNAIQKR